VNDVHGLSEHKALRRMEVQTEKGPVSVVCPAPRWSDGIREYGAVPALGAHTDAIRQEFAA
jgi:itaconate CoA-transferase